MSLMMCPMFEESKPPLDKALMIVFESPSKITCFRLSSCAKPMALRAANTSTISTELQHLLTNMELIPTSPKQRHNHCKQVEEVTVVLAELNDVQERDTYPRAYEAKRT
nr:hypothetical protein CFP56_69607 [Quercus suber]